MNDKKEIDDTRLRLLQEGSAIFARDGYARTRTQEICHAAKANPAAVNYYFDGKDGFYLAVWEYALQQAVGKAEGLAISKNEDREWLYQYVYASVLAVFNVGPKGHLRQLMQHELKVPSPLADTVMDAHVAPRLMEMNRRLRRILGPKVSEFQVNCCAAAIHSQCTALNLSRYFYGRLFGTREPSEQEVEHFAREMCAFIIGGVRAIKSSQGAARNEE